MKKLTILLSFAMASCGSSLQFTATPACEHPISVTTIVEWEAANHVVIDTTIKRFLCVEPAEKDKIIDRVLRPWTSKK